MFQSGLEERLRDKFEDLFKNTSVDSYPKRRFPVSHFLSSLPVSLPDLSLFLYGMSGYAGLFECKSASELLFNFGIALGSLDIIPGLLEFPGKRKNQIDFERIYGMDPYSDDLPERDIEEIESDASELAEELNNGYVPLKLNRREVAFLVNRAITCYLAKNTGEAVLTSNRVGGKGLLSSMFTFAPAMTDFFSGYTCINYDTGVLEPFAIGHEFCHRKGYRKETTCNLIPYFAFMETQEPFLVQSALTSRLMYDIDQLSCEYDTNPFKLLDELGLRDEIKSDLKKFIGHELLWYQKLAALPIKALNLIKSSAGLAEGIESYSDRFTDYLHYIENHS